MSGKWKGMSFSVLFGESVLKSYLSPISLGEDGSPHWKCQISKLCYQSRSSLRIWLSRISVLFSGGLMLATIKKSCTKSVKMSSLLKKLTFFYFNHRMTKPWRSFIMSTLKPKILWEHLLTLHWKWKVNYSKLRVSSISSWLFYWGFSVACCCFFHIEIESIPISRFN